MIRLENDSRRAFRWCHWFVATSLLLGHSLGLVACRHQPSTECVMYSSIDETYAIAVVRKFQEQTGINVKLVCDSEETKSTGLINRLLAERARPVADVFWSGDVMRAAVLKRRGLTVPYARKNSSEPLRHYDDPDNHYLAGSARMRLILYHRASAGVTLPDSVLDLAKPEFAKHACMANPLFGTTSMHAAVLFEQLGEETATRFFTDFHTNGGRMLSSNGEVRRRVADGEFSFGLTDSDDVSVAFGDDKPVGYIIPDQSAGGAVLIPSAVALIKGGPHKESAQRLADFLNSAEVEEAMAKSSAAHFPLRPELAPPALFGKRLQEIKTVQLDYSRLAVRIESLQAGFLKRWVEAQ